MAALTLSAMFWHLSQLAMMSNAEKHPTKAKRCPMFDDGSEPLASDNYLHCIIVLLSLTLLKFHLATNYLLYNNDIFMILSWNPFNKKMTN